MYYYYVLAFQARWRGLLHHIVDKHEWVLGDDGGPARCEHEEIEQQEKTWLEAGSQPHERLRQVVLDKKLMKESAHYVNFRSVIIKCCVSTVYFPEI